MEEKCAVVFDAGFSTPITQVTLADVPLIVRAVCLNTVVSPVKCELDQLASGLALFGILDLVKSHPKDMAALFVHDSTSKLTAEIMMGLFSMRFSPVGSSKRIAEESVIQNWNEFLQDLDQGVISKSCLCN